MNRKKKIAFIVQRYGLEVNGGAESYCRQIAERLNNYYDIEILTTCAIDYVTWKNEYKEGIDNVNGIVVRRFPVERERNDSVFSKITNLVFTNKAYDYNKEIEWMYEQGPYSLKLLNYIKENRDTYDVFIFITYLYFTTYFGLQLVPGKSILVSTAHDEPPIHLDIFNSLFHLPRAFIFLTEEEKEFVQGKFKNDYIMNNVIGIGVDTPKEISVDRFVNKYKIDGDFIVYVGRIDESKGCKELFDYFIRYKKETGSKLKLVLMGKSVMKIPKNEDIISLGFVSDEDKFDGIAASKLLVLPSLYESLSMSVLESMALGVPVLVNGKCEVLKGHCVRSNAGLYYEDYLEFKGCLFLLNNNNILKRKMKVNGQSYIEKNYKWETITTKYTTLLDKLV